MSDREKIEMIIIHKGGCTGICSACPIGDKNRCDEDADSLALAKEWMEEHLEPDQSDFELHPECERMVGGNSIEALITDRDAKKEKRDMLTKELREDNKRIKEMEKQFNKFMESK